MKEYAESPLFNPYFKPKEYLDEIVGALGMYKAPFIKTDEELRQTQMGTQLVETLGKLAASGGPEVQAKIQQFLQSITGQGGQPINVTGGNGGEGGGAIPAEPAPTNMGGI